MPTFKIFNERDAIDMTVDDECPCKECVAPKRTSDCHAKCPEYAEFFNNNEAKKQAKKEFSQVDRYFATRSKYTRKWNQ